MRTVRMCYAFLTAEERRKSFFFLALMLVGAAFESIGIGLFMPFVALINDPALIHTSRKLKWVYETVGSPSQSAFLIGVGVALIAMFLLKALYIGKLTFAQNRFISKIYIRISRMMLERYLDLPYEEHLERNQAEFSQRVVASSGTVARSVLGSCLTLFSEGFVVLILTALLLLANPVAVLAIGLGMGGFSFLLYQSVRAKIRALADVRVDGLLQANKWMDQSFGSVKEVKILGRETFFGGQFSRHNAVFSDSDATMTSIGQIPRLCIEGAAISSLTLFVIALLASGHDPKSAIPALALFAMAAFRMMPSINRILASAILIRQGHSEVIGLYEDYSRAPREQPRPSEAHAKPHAFEKEIECREVSYNYPKGRSASLQNVSIKIARGQSVAFVGPSGAGKTTLVDALVGLLPITNGQILVDGRDIRLDRRGWQKAIGYIPQAIYLSDDTIRRNVAFGLEDDQIDDSRVWDALRLAQLDRFVRDLPSSVDTKVGDRGVRLSGGQRQRIGIARALYPNPSVLVLDEATSALDNDTENAVIQAIETLKGTKTIIVIAHRLTTVARCDKLYFLRSGQVVGSGTYDELRTQSADFRKFAAL